jgi:hypothetical protein
MTVDEEGEGDVSLSCIFLINEYLFITVFVSYVNYLQLPSSAQAQAQAGLS